MSERGELWLTAVILEIVASEPGLTSARIENRIDEIIMRDWQAAGGILRWLSGWRVARLWHLVVRCGFWSVLFRLSKSGRIRRERSQAAHWNDDIRDWIHTFRYFPRP